MLQTIRTIKTVAASVILLTGPLQSQAGAQTTYTAGVGNLNLKESSGPAPGYAFLVPILPEGRTPQVSVQLKPESTLGVPENWTWKVVDSDAALKSLVTFKWYAQAACPDDLTALSVSGPGGLLVQNPLWNPIWGYFSTQSFSLSTVKNICINWANADSCDPAEPGCQLYETFSVVGANADRLRLKASCVSGPVADKSYSATMELRCNRGY